jgi:hypothetical protein
MIVKHKAFRTSLSIIILLFLLFCTISRAFSTKKKVEVCTDVSFVQEQFPDIKDIKKVKYYYNVKSNKREIGLQNIEFCGFIWIGEEFCEKILDEYQWKETPKSKKIMPKEILLEKEDSKFRFLYSYDFSHDGKYKSHSWGGDFYFDKEHRMLYFECEW